MAFVIMNIDENYGGIMDNKKDQPKLVMQGHPGSGIKGKTLTASYAAAIAAIHEGPFREIDINELHQLAVEPYAQPDEQSLFANGGKMTAAEMKAKMEALVAFNREFDMILQTGPNADFEGFADDTARSSTPVSKKQPLKPK